MQESIFHCSDMASEQLFSSAGQLCSDRRDNLICENAKNLLGLVLAYTLIRLFGFSY